ncbi:MAG: hypothetical protein OXF65_08700 [Acidimicrobiaceae bacterium]|nr:hypothetical protein [Acidimicrobiaceae bacterium]
MRHTHTCPTGTTGTYPNCRRIERDTRTSEQAAEDERKREQAEAERKQKAAEAERKCRETEEAERKRKAEEARRKAQEQRQAEEARKRREAAEAERKRKAAEEAERQRCHRGTRPANCRPQQQNNADNQQNANNEPKDATNTPITDLIRDVGSVLSCEWASQSGGNVGLICDSIAFTAPLLWDDITSEDITGDKVLRDAGMWAACYRVGITPRIRLACGGLTIVVDPLADAIGKFSNKGADRGKMEPPDPDKTDKDGDSSQPPPTGTTTPEADPILENPTMRQYLAEFGRYLQAVKDYGRGKISAAERMAATARYKQVRCNRGLPGDQRYC